MASTPAPSAPASTAKPPQPAATASQTSRASPSSSAPPHKPFATSSYSNLNAAGDPKMSQSRPSSQQSLPMSQPSSQNYAHLSSSQQRPGPSQRQGHDQIYTAVYSGINVYEMEVNGVAVMRRRNDSCLNATQILKVAGVDKGKRTKILEKEIQTGEHEKVQGGYGKYQGTWISFDRGVQVCSQYGVTDILRPLLTYDMGQDGGVAGRGDLDTPTKEQAMAANRKRMYNNAAINEGRNSALSGTFFKNISSTASNAVAAISKARLDSPGSRGRNGPAKTPSFSRQSSMQNADDFPSHSQQSLTSEYGQNPDSAFSTNGQMVNGEEPPRKRQRVATPADSFGYNSQNMEVFANNYPGSPTEPNESFIYSQGGINVHDTEDPPEGTPLPPLPFEDTPEAERRRKLIMDLFAVEERDDYSEHPALTSLSPLEIDSPIDRTSHTALHWAATLARIPILRELIAVGANPFRLNAAGETALMRAVAVTNSSEQNLFPALLEILGNTVEVRDFKGRTILHHITAAGSIKGRSRASRYYLDSLLEWIIRQGTPPASQIAANGDAGASWPRLTLGTFMSNMVNLQDKQGNTALHNASRVGNKSLISQLLEIGANPSISNDAGLKPVDFGIGHIKRDAAKAEDVVTDSRNGNGSNSQQSRQSSDDIVTSITQLLSETTSAFQGELRQKQTDLDSLHASLRTKSTQLSEAKAKLASLQTAAKTQALSRQRISNLLRGRTEEENRLREAQHSSTRGAASSPTSESKWEADIITKPASQPTEPKALLLARKQAVLARLASARRAIAALKGRSKEEELKYRRVVALCTGVPENEVDSLLDGLLRAVESEGGDLELGRVRKFLGGVEG